MSGLGILFCAYWRPGGGLSWGAVFAGVVGRFSTAVFRQAEERGG